MCVYGVVVFPLNYLVGTNTAALLVVRGISCGYRNVL